MLCGAVLWFVWLCVVWSCVLWFVWLCAVWGCVLWFVWLCVVWGCVLCGCAVLCCAVLYCVVRWLTACTVCDLASLTGRSCNDDEVSAHLSCSCHYPACTDTGDVAGTSMLPSRTCSRS